ncbi:hypothetical protein ABES02_29340 [Neobacillus pocheonensis]|uniref:hypothetical protein n=1 Tax=Neobacillus pocheonensis TaxID=363869 RepID=UPI003D2BC443
MNRTLLLLALGLLLIFMQFYNVDRFSNTTIHDRSKYSLHRAAHDAALQVNPALKVNGQIVFVRDKALQAFKDTFAKNMSLKPDLSPKPNTLLKNPVEIIFEDYIDDQSGVTFPYNYVNSQYGINKTIKGPAVIYEIRTKAVKHSTYSYDGYIYKNVIFEYPYPLP